MKFNFSPTKEFKEKAKARFLAAFDARYPAPPPVFARPRAPEFILAMRALVIVLAIAAVVIGGASVYADTANVPADNPLYPLKRLDESVQLTLTVPAAKPQLEATLAARRANEIIDLAERHPTSTLLPRLANDLTNAVSASLSGAENETKHAPAISSSAAPTSASTGTLAPRNVPAEGRVPRFATSTVITPHASTTFSAPARRIGERSGDGVRDPPFVPEPLFFARRRRFL